MWREGIFCVFSIAVDPEPQGAETFGRSRSHNEDLAPAPGQTREFHALKFSHGESIIRINTVSHKKCVYSTNFQIFQ